MTKQQTDQSTDRQRARFAEHYSYTPEETSACLAYVNKYWKKEMEHRIRIADEVSQGIFLFDLPWDMEQTAEPVAFEGEIDWMYQPGEDPEFIFQMNRHRYWVCLGQAYAMTGDEAYARAYAEQLVSWVRKNPITEETRPKTWRTIEAGLRGESWIKAMGYFVKSPQVSDEVFAIFLESMAAHGAYLAACDVPFSVKSNWGVLENSGLYAIGNMLLQVGGYPEAENYVNLAKGRLVRQIEVQVMDDGVHWEQSPMYHNEVLKCYLEVLRVASLAKDTVPRSLVEKVKSMAYADRIWQKPDGSQPSGGDSDVTDLRDVLTVCAYWFRDPVLKSGGFSRMDYEGVWDYGIDSVKQYEEISSQTPQETHTWLKDSGNWYLRSSWETDADYLHVRCGSLGGGHGHFDKCHMDLVIGGRDILVDPGRYTYVDGTLRRKLKSARAHNGFTVDGAEYTHCLDSWGVKGILPAVTGNMCRKGAFTLIECGHLGYIEQGVYAERRILAIGTRMFLVMDTCYGSGAHSLEQHFHLARGLRPELRENGITTEDNNCHVTIQCASHNVEIRELEFPVSSHYNQIEAGRAITFSGKGQNTFSMITAIVCQDLPANPVSVKLVPVESPVKGSVLEAWKAEAVEVSCGEKSWLVVNAHAEAGADCEYVGADGYYGLGRVMAVEKSAPEREEMTVLRW